MKRAGSTFPDSVGLGWVLLGLRMPDGRIRSEGMVDRSQSRRECREASLTDGDRAQPRRSHHVGRVVFAALALVVAACSGDDPVSGETRADVAAGDSAPVTTQTDDLAAELGFGVREYGLTDEEWTAAIESVQGLIAECMGEAGFEYVPADVDTVELAMSAVRTEPGVSRQEYKEQWGYGVTTRFDNRVKEIELGEQNLAIYAQLSEADKVAYDRTLYGDDPDATFAFQFDEEDFEPTGGCTRQAIEATFTDEQLDPNFVNPKDILVAEDGRVAEAELQWADCMGEAGYEYEDQDEIIEEYQELLDELLEGEDPETLAPVKAEGLEQLQQEEIAVSLVDLECQIEYTDDVIRQVEVELFGREVSG